MPPQILLIPPSQFSKLYQDKAYQVPFFLLHLRYIKVKLHASHPVVARAYDEINKNMSS